MDYTMLCDYFQYCGMILILIMIPVLVAEHTINGGE